MSKEKIIRYDFEYYDVGIHTGHEMKESATGEYVKYEDVKNQLQQQEMSDADIESVALDVQNLCYEKYYSYWAETRAIIKCLKSKLKGGNK